jgi:hypothetical protein
MLPFDNGGPPADTEGPRAVLLGSQARKPICACPSPSGRPQAGDRHSLTWAAVCTRDSIHADSASRLPCRSDIVRSPPHAAGPWKRWPNHMSLLGAQAHETIVHDPTNGEAAMEPWRR